MPLPVAAETRAPIPSRASEAPPGEDRGFLGGIDAAFTAAYADALGADHTAMETGYGEVVDALQGMGYDINSLVSVGRSQGGVLRERVWSLVEKHRADGHFSDLPATRAEFEAGIMESYRKRVERAERDTSAGGWSPFLIGSLRAGVVDPLTFGTFPVGGLGSTAVRRIGSQFAVQAGIQGAATPFIAEQRRVQGRRDLSLEEGAAMVLFAGAGGAGLQGIGELARVGAPALFKRLPDSVQRRLAPSSLREADIIDAMIADVEAKGDLATQAEIDAASVLSEAREARKASLLGDNGASRALDEALQDEAVQRIMTAPPPEAAPARPPAPRPDTFTMASAEARFMAKTRRAESGGDDAARNSRSSATGRYQFIDSTWLAYYKRRYGAEGLSDAQILAKRGSGAIQDQLMRDLTADNAAFLREAGEAVTEGNLYLVHFAGPANAMKLFGADPARRAIDVLPGRVIDANPFLRDMSVEDVLRWAHRKMGQGGVPPRAGARAQLAEGLDGAIGRNDAERFAIQDELDRALANEDAARASLQASADDPVNVALKAEATPMGEPAIYFDPAARPLDPDPEPEITAIMSPLESVALETRRSINDMSAIARELGVSEAEVRSGLERLVERGDITQNSKTGHFMRKGNPGILPQNTKRPRTLLEFLAERGGLNDAFGEVQSRGIRVGDTRFGKPIIRTTERAEGPNALSGEGQYGLDDAFTAAREAGYFPEFEGRIEDSYADLLDNQGLLLAAIDDELAGNVRYSQNDWDRLGEYGLTGSTEGDFGGMRAASDEPARSATVEDFRQAWIDEGLDPDDLDDAFLARAADLYESGEAFLPEQAMAMAAREDYEAALRAAVDEGLEAEYGESYDPWNPEWDAEFERRLQQLQESDSANGRAGGGQTRDPFDPRESGGGGEAAARGQPDAFGQGQRIAELPDEERAAFLDPQDEAVARQVESLEHDMRMASDPNIAARQRQEAQLRAEAPLRGENATGEAQDGTMGLGLFDSADQPEFRLDAEGDAESPADMLARMDAEEAELDAIRSCLKPKGGE